MKKYDVVKIVKLNKKMQDLNLQLGFHGVVMSSNLDYSEVLFFNDYNLGDTTFCKVANNLLVKENERLPNGIVEMLNKIVSSDERDRVLTKTKFKECDFVEIIVEKAKYAKHNVHCGERGYVVLDDMINGEVLVDFADINADGEIRGEQISVNINDLKLVEEDG